ncbi:unnamed protein product [Cuscuta epithymum]|uniref:Uncharacterized protein n=1 Tax=Cuscuta epithymum TaxID=186058 RepID=A0AAV0GCX9_9ASTE|nr:unnamed protein product [Cuscuta epithymum]
MTIDATISTADGTRRNHEMIRTNAIDLGGVSLEKTQTMTNSKDDACPLPRFANEQWEGLLTLIENFRAASFDAKLSGKGCKVKWHSGVSYHMTGCAQLMIFNKKINTNTSEHAERRNHTCDKCGRCTFKP